MSVSSCCIIIESMTSKLENNTLWACRLIAVAVELGLTDDTHHWFFESSSETPTCVVEVGSPADVSIAVRSPINSTWGWHG